VNNIKILEVGDFFLKQIYYYNGFIILMKAIKIEQEIKNTLINGVVSIPAMNTFANRSLLLNGMAIDTSLVPRNEGNSKIDIVHMVHYLESLGILKNGERPLIIFVNNALFYVNNSGIMESLKEILEELEKSYGNEEEADISIEKDLNYERLIFTSKDTRVPYGFMKKALQSSKSVARLLVPRYFDGTKDTSQSSRGTGWVVTDNLLITNYHVITAREKDETLPGDEDLRRQAEQTILWFDYYEEGKTCVEVVCTDLVHYNKGLDYALLRIAPGNSRPPLKVKIAPPLLHKQKTRLNIVQNSGGGPIKYAIRNNYGNVPAIGSEIPRL
jgi:hypothetical protein